LLRKSVAILNRMTGTSIANTRNIEILEHLIREAKDESSLHFAVTIVKDLNTQLVFSESDVSDDRLISLQSILWKEWDMRQWLSAKQFFVVINTLSKEKPAKQLHLSIREILMHNLSIFDTDNGIALHDTIEKELCSAFDKFMLIPCLNYLALSDWITQQEEFLCFSQMLQNINFKADESQAIDGKVLEEAITFDLRLRSTESPPNISIENHVATLLQCYPQHTELTVQLLLDKTNKNIKNQELTRILQLIWTKDEGNKKKKTLTSKMLHFLLKDKKKRAYWIELLANSSIISDHNLFLKLLQDSLQGWLHGTEEKKGDAKNVPFHSKVIELVSSDTFAKAKSFHQSLIKSVNEGYQELWLNNKKWTSEEIRKVNWELWQQILNQIDNIPKVEDLDEKNVESASKNLCSNLDYCFECRLWFEQKNLMQPRLFTFFNQVLAQLITKDNLLPIHIYEYLVRHWKVIKDISSHFSMNVNSLLPQLEKIVNEYRQFSKLLHTFKCIRCNYLFEHDLSDRLKEFEHQSDNWKAQGFASVKEKYKDEIQLLKLYEQKMKLILKRNQSSIFQKIWEKYHKQCKSIRDQTPLFIFNKVFDDMDHTWENFKQVHSTPFGSLKYKDLEWVSTKYSNDSRGIKKRLMSEMKYLFPKYKEKRQQEIANNAKKKLKKEIHLKEQLPSWLELMKVTEQMKEYHPHNDKIKEDKKWRKYVKALARMEEVTRTNEDISIEQTSQCYDDCIECVGEGAKPCMDIGLFNALTRCEDQLKILAENQNFNDEAYFDNTLNVLRKNRHQAIQDLVTSLRCVNSTMQNTLWKCPLEDMTSLAKAILKLHPKGQEFVKMIRKCCNKDLSTISTIVNEADKIRTEESLKQLKDAMAFGEWQFASCEDVLQGKKGKELMLKINDTTWYCEEIGENVDRVLLGVKKQELKEIESVIQQFEECKEVNSYRIEFWKKGGRIDIINDNKRKEEQIYDDKKPFCLSVALQKDEFENCKELWKQRLMEWKKQCLELRKKFPVLNYFCFNQVHFLIKKVNQLNMPNCPDRAIKASKYIKPFLQKINCDVTDRDVNNVLKDWTNFNSKDLDQYNFNNNNNFRQCRDSIAKFGKILNPIWMSSQHNCVDEKPFSIGLHAGKPNLIIGSKELLFELLEHILICNKTTTEEDI
ncbi:viral A-type inclusion protein, partial [Reticulomyxa filosa]